MKVILKNTPSIFLLITSVWLFSATAKAEDKAGYRITVQKTTLTRDDIRTADAYADRIDRTLGLKVAIKNVSMKDKAEAEISYAIIVSRWGYSPPRYEKYQGKEKLAALKPQEEVDLTLGKARIGGYANYANKRYQDKVEVWQVAIIQEGKEIANFTNGSNYERLNAKSIKPSEQ